MWSWPKEKCPFLCQVFSPRQRCKEPCSLKYTWDTDELGQYFYFLSFYYILTCVCHELRYWSTSFSTESNSGSWVPSYKHLLNNVLHQTELWKYFWNLSLLTQHSFWVDCESVAAVLSSKGTSVLFLGSPMALGNQALFVTKKSRLKILTSILCLPQCPCVLLYLRPKPKGGAEARHWKTSWKRRSPNAKKQRERKKISHNNNKKENE